MKFAQLLTLGLALSATSAMARPEFAQTFRTKYKPARGSALATATCSTCHVGDTTKLNPYGKDLQKGIRNRKLAKLTDAVLASVEKLDSDKDGVSNIAEIRAGSLPGDPHVKPKTVKPHKAPAPKLHRVPPPKYR